MARTKRPAPAPDGISLRLRQNAFVRGVFTTEGTVIPFSETEAKRRLERTRLWELA